MTMNNKLFAVALMSLGVNPSIHAQPVATSTQAGEVASLHNLGVAVDQTKGEDC